MALSRANSSRQPAVNVSESAPLSPASSHFYLTMKRLLDLCGAAAGLLILSPLLLLIAISIKLADPRNPVFFVQTRIGKDGKPFRIYKFRSMVVDAEKMLDGLLTRNDASGAMFKMKNDPRVTRIGRFLRRTSLDELPQFVNVLKGEMSLVGPRPPLPREVANYTRYDRQRLSVKPGCTGLWQVSGRNSVGFKTMVDIDLDYIKRRSLSLDVKIICKTVLVMIQSKNAY